MGGVMVFSFDVRVSNDLEIQCEPHHGKRSQFSAGNFDVLILNQTHFSFGCLLTRKQTQLREFLLPKYGVEKCDF